MSQAVDAMENWRLSRIEEELDNLELVEDPDSLPPYPGTEDDCSTPGSREDLPRIPPPQEEIYSKVVILPAYKTQPDPEERSREATRFITEKYDSLGRVKVKPALPPSDYIPSVDAGMYHRGGEKLPLVEGYNTNGSMTDVGDRGVKMPFSNLSGMYVPHVHQDPPAYPGVAAPIHVPPSPVLPPPAPARAPRTPTRDTNPITEADILQAELFYRSHKTEVFVGQALAGLYLGTVRAGSPTKGQPNSIHPNPHDPDKWMYLKTGIPVLVMDSGESRRARKIHVILAERGTGFVLWKECMNHLTHYTVATSNFHTLHLSNDHTRLAGFNFDDAVAAGEFHQKIRQLTSDGDDDVLNLSGKKAKKKKSKKSSKKSRPPTKADISTPCCFTHVTRLDRTDGMSLLNSSLPTSPSRELANVPAPLGVRRNSASRKT